MRERIIEVRCSLCGWNGFFSEFDTVEFFCPECGEFECLTEVDDDVEGDR